MDNGQQRFAPYATAMVPVRQQIHANPELAFEEFETAALVAKMLGEWGYEVTTGIGGTGVVGTLRAGSGNTAIGLRADMDALPIVEATGLPYASQVPGKMHACGHDGHTAMLLGAAKYLAETRNFSGVVNLIFQPAEEGKAGAKAMIEDGLFERFPCEAVYGIHNGPGTPVGELTFAPGPFAAANDRLDVVIEGKGGHAAQPDTTFDPIVAGSAVVQALQSVVSRNVHPLDSAVVSVAMFRAGETFNVIPQKAEMKLSLRTHTPAVRALVNARVRKLITDVADAYNCTATVIAAPNPYPPLINDAEATEHGRTAAVAALGEANVKRAARPMMGSEDFSFMLEKNKGAYFFMGNGTEGPNGIAVHNPGYDFNDAALLPGIAFWATLVEQELKA
ncbi:M20 aminoacylase family protein [Ketogulonicigenium vulgare]|uniref:HipO-like protein Amidohydrolase n=1 Tax=Ketogulonicigenium vulgare (strain WSH-001) TaxID=759362 RepID=F9Y612_KETVW|nr:M20 aminoacylase family protein [Ketogulonicigenium vulgare]ADO42645.1 amidohydrolase [Ketogulonicigenium vulgare Y25]AEM40837.1 hipO-like protein Amidohydrolase [Ketogulonicigenium vulgare WSH-001]ALJ82311.1 amidohydrolase [Ketogulonicigenium vulgare]ANW35019.1 amidohydrolase [Ketogulonicigenium vulgare]AOZ54555.1 amidohydrolase [Ketogulonicigenium vulgare]